MNKAVLAYLAGAMDADGYFTIKRSTYHRRVRKDATNPVFSEKMGLHQVTKEVPQLLQRTFGGSLYLAPPQTSNSRPMWRWTATDRNAAKACALLLPHLIIKREQAMALLELRKSKSPGYRRAAYWFAKRYPKWKRMRMITASEAVRLLGLRNRAILAQAVRKGGILALPWNHVGKEAPRFPEAMVSYILTLSGKDGGARLLPPELVAWRQRLHDNVRVLNTLGINGTSCNHRTGIHTPKG